MVLGFFIAMVYRNVAWLNPQTPDRESPEKDGSWSVGGYIFATAIWPLLVLLLVLIGVFGGV